MLTILFPATKTTVSAQMLPISEKNPPIKTFFKFSYLQKFRFIVFIILYCRAARSKTAL